jgi:hypothetical protein
VTFKDGATTLGTGTLNPSGQATFSTSSLSAGSHSITAEYGGDSNFNGSISAVFTQIAAYNLTVNITGHGTVRVEPPGPYAADVRVILYIEPDPGYHVSNVTVDGVPIGAVNIVTFREMMSNHTVDVTFE